MNPNEHISSILCEMNGVYIHRDFWCNSTHIIADFGPREGDWNPFQYVSFACHMRLPYYHMSPPLLGFKRRTNSLSHVHYMGVSHSQYFADTGREILPSQHCSLVILG